MKKKYLYPLALACTLCLFTACSDDDDVNAWEQLPQTEISGAKANLTLNGTTLSEGSVQLTVNNATAGVLTLKNVVPGYPSIPVNVSLEEQADGSFRFSGQADVNALPEGATERNLATVALLKVTANGTITQDGTVKADISADGAAFHLGAYSGSTLSLNYSGVPMLGKTVAYSVAQNVPVLTLAGVVPGEPALSVPGVYPQKGAFTFETTTAAGTTVKGNGQFQNGALSLDVTVKLGVEAQGGLTGEWPLATTIGTPVGWSDVNYSDYAPVRIVWTAVNDQATNGGNISKLGTLLGSHLMAEVLNGITLTEDGNLTARYYPDIVTGADSEEEEDMLQWMMGKLEAYQTAPATREWLTSPKNLMQWYAKDGQIYLVPNLVQILQQAATDQNDPSLTENIDTIMGVLQALNGLSDEELKGLLAGFGQQAGIDLSVIDPQLIRQVAGWMTNGVPLKYTLDGNGGLRLYADKGMVSPFMPLLLTFLPQLQAKYDELLKEADAETAMYLQIAMGILGLEKFTDLETVWNENTAEFAVGLGFQK